jgi:hypothetical protein
MFMKCFSRSGPNLDIFQSELALRRPANRREAHFDRRLPFTQMQVETQIRGRVRCSIGGDHAAVMRNIQDRPTGVGGVVREPNGELNREPRRLPLYHWQYPFITSGL